MSIKLELDADSIKQAISAHIAAQGFNLEGKNVEVALVNGRGGNGNRATVTISDDVVNNKVPTTVKEAIDYHPEVEEVVVEEEVTFAGVSTEDAIGGSLHPDTIDPILAAAENNEDEELFPKVDPADIKTSTSLF